MSSEKPSRPPWEIFSDYCNGKNLLNADEIAFIRRVRKEAPWLFANYRSGGSSYERPGSYRPPKKKGGCCSSGSSKPSGSCGGGSCGSGSCGSH